MMRIREIETHFEENFPKKSLTILSLDEKNEITLVKSEKLSFDFDSVVKKNDKIIKTADTLFFKNNKIIFVEFKSGKIGNLDFRLKSTESIISFYNYIFKNNFQEPLTIPNAIFEIYFVYNKRASSATLNTFSQIERELKLEYKHLFSKFKMLDNEQFTKLFRI
ncbi:hypothetical protein FLBR109950_11580 [Flavobacterium branchiophilum]|uniref:Uncharacterized protein n=1 Tax=Flavobacterium branchiophilum (strain FL-15) TaxID=1034807 RepID=G2Z624_FLABF|nr:hypothetical protein [Flavobacterium branchiophilum]CCB68789.1 Hypothetical protein FBFL15_0680 [Flavobacterium branchiophilum FL-15]